MSESGKKPKPPEDFDENPEWTKEDFARAETGLPKPLQAAGALRRAAAELRAQADALDDAADRLDKDDAA